MIEAFLWGALGASSLLLGAVLAAKLTLPAHLIGTAMGFGAGALISAVSFELVADAYEHAHGTWVPPLGIALGAIAFAAGDWYIDRRGGAHRKRIGEDAASHESSPSGIVLGTVLDGVPESLVVGGSLVTGGGVSVAMVAAAFLSNMPESLGATAGLLRAGTPRRRVMGMWVGIVLLSGLSAAIGYRVLEEAPARLGALFQTFAAGSILTMLADSMMPEAFREGGRMVGLATVVGFALAFWISAAG